MEVQVEAVSPAERGVLTSLLDEYLTELTTHRDADLGATRASEYRYLDAYFGEAGRQAFLIRREGRVVGFAMIRGPESTGAGWQVAEFFVTPAYRRTGVGRTAISMLWSRLPGDWELQVHARNTASIDFWTSCIQGVARVEPTVVSLESSGGRRLQFNFRVDGRRVQHVASE